MNDKMVMHPTQLVTQCVTNWKIDSKSAYSFEQPLSVIKSSIESLCLVVLCLLLVSRLASRVKPRDGKAITPPDGRVT